MPWLFFTMLLSVATTGLSINRPVYKIVLKQKGYAQFLQYDIETPPLREFTFCTWIRIYDLSGDQSIFTYVANSNNRVVRLWLDSGGKNINVSINGKVTSSTTVDIMKDVWRHVCLSYQSDFGAWALYVDSRLVSCQASQSLYGFVLPGGGSVIIGYGTAEIGTQNGLEGEIFGANMILTSTIERNYTIKNDPVYQQKRFRKNQMKPSNHNTNYIILSDLQTGELRNNFETTQQPAKNLSKSFIKFRTPDSYIEHAVGLDLSTTKKQTLLDIGNEKDFMGFSVTEKNPATEGLTFWNLNKNEHSGKYNAPKIKNLENDLVTPSLMLSEFETPPPAPAFTFLDKTLEIESSVPETTYKFNMGATEPGKSQPTKKYVDGLSEIETPPPVDKNTKVYGQWTSSKFAGSVLNYLKQIQSRTREQKKVPQTIPLSKLSDSFPYASDFKVIKIRPPLHFQRRNLVEKQFETSKRSPQINVQIFEDDLRNNIIKSHAQTQPKHVEITNRGMRKQKQEHRFYRNVDNQDSNESYESTETIHSPKAFTLPSKRKPADLTLQTNNLLSILPFLKSLEYFVENSQHAAETPKKRDDMYTKSLASGNKWHNVKSYSNDYTPREIKLDTDEGQSGIEKKIAQVNKRHPAIRLNYKHDNNKVVPFKDEKSILKGRKLAMEVSNQSDYNKDSISILKYNHGFLPGHTKKIKVSDKVHGPHINIKTNNINNIKDNFNQQVKIGNALNERHLVGVNVEQNKQSFVGGNENIPDINKYRSDIDNDNLDSMIPGSLGPRICRNLELYDRVLYVQPDESIDMTHILSPVRVKNVGIEFILQNYKKCSLQESDLQNNAMLYIDWSKTPVRLFGGSYPKKTTDLCGFF